MAGVGVDHVSFDARELREMGQRIRAAATRRRQRRLMEQLAVVGESAARERFDTGGPAPDGEQWPPRHPLSTSTKPLLNRDGHLAQSISSSASGLSARWGSNRIYARIHQLGGVIRPRRRKRLRFQVGRRTVFARQVTIPARPYLGWGEAEESQAALTVRNWLEQGLAGGEA